VRRIKVLSARASRPFPGLRLQHCCRTCNLLCSLNKRAMP
jgi:hypothetical protein